MRILKVAIYILAALVTGEFSYKVNAASFQLSKEVEVSNFTAVDYTAISQTSNLLILAEIEAQTFAIGALTNTGIEAIASPSVFSRQEFATRQSLAEVQTGKKATSPQTPSLKAADLSNQLAQATIFSDLQGNWAQSFITALAARGIIVGFPDGTF